MTTTNAESISIQTETSEVTGCLISPATKAAGVLFVHGWGANRKQILRRATEVAGLGCICLTLELGKRDTSRNLAELVAAYDRLVDHPDIDRNAIALVGSSYGGFIAALATELRAIRWLALRAPALPDLEADEEAVKRLQQARAADGRQVITADSSEALRACTGFKGDALVVESRYDDVVPRIVVRSYVDAFIQAGSITYRMLPDADHGLSTDAHQDAYTKILVRWLREMVTDARIGAVVDVPKATPVVPRGASSGPDAAAIAEPHLNGRVAQMSGAKLNEQG